MEDRSEVEVCEPVPVRWCRGARPFGHGRLARARRGRACGYEPERPTARLVGKGKLRAGQVAARVRIRIRIRILWGWRGHVEEEPEVGLAADRAAGVARLVGGAVGVN